MSKEKVSKEIKAFKEIEYRYSEADFTDEEIKWFDTVEKALTAYNILKRYVAEVTKYPGNKQSPYWICFGGFEGENGDLTKDEYDLLKEELK